MFRINTVCTGNICRSPMAEYLIRAELEAAGVTDVEVCSTAVSPWEVGNPIDPRAGALLMRLGIDSSAHVARQFEDPDFDADLILALDVEHYEALRRMAPTAEAAQKVRMLRSFDPAAGPEIADQGIYDPWYGDESDFEATHALISAAMPGLIDHLRTEAR